MLDRGDRATQSPHPPDHYADASEPARKLDMPLSPQSTFATRSASLATARRNRSTKSGKEWARNEWQNAYTPLALHSSYHSRYYKWSYAAYCHAMYSRSLDP